jgi:hypothetical protein
LREHHTVQIDDMRTDTRWPAFAREARQRGILSLLSFQLFVRSENLGALNLYGDEPGVFSDHSVIIGSVLAQHAAVASVQPPIRGSITDLPPATSSVKPKEC